jgi:glycosyltransferase involved in cell wall biosynthesis
MDGDQRRMNRPKLALVQDLPVGGAKRAFGAMLSVLAKDCDITVFEFDRSDQSVFALSASGVQTRSFPAPALSSTRLLKIPLLGLILVDLYLRAYYRRIVAEIHNGSFDVVMVTQSRITNTPPVLGMLEPPVIYACHEPTRVLYEPYYARESAPRRLLRKLHNAANHWFARLRERRLISNATVVLANSYYSAEVFYRLFQRPAVVAYPGVDGEVFARVPGPVSSYVLSVGSLDMVKGHDFVLECVGRIPRDLRPDVVIICPHGTDSEAESAHLRQLARTLGVNLDILSGISDDQLVQRYSGALATVFCSRLEPFGLVSIEAMACGCPVLALAEGGLRETVVDGETGFLLPRDPDAFAAKLLLLIGSACERKRLGANGARHVRQKFTWERCAQSAREAIAASLSNAGPSSSHHRSTEDLSSGRSCPR